MGFLRLSAFNCLNGAYRIWCNTTTPTQDATIVRLTDFSIKALKPPPTGQKLFTDDSVRGFGVRISHGGTRTFVLMHGAERQLKTIGRVGIISLAEARDTAKKFLAAKTLGKHTPPAMAFSVLRKEFLEASALKHKPRTTAEYTRLLKRVRFSTIQDITPRDVSAQVQRFIKSPNEANHILTALKALFTYAAQQHYIQTNPARPIPLPSKHTPRSRVLSSTELKSVWNALEGDTFSTIVRLLILTGQRRSEIAHIAVSGDEGTIDGSHTKNGLQHVFPVAPAAKELLGYDLTFNGWGKSKKRLDAASGVKDWTLHDLRRTYATIHAQIGTPIHVIEKLLNHISGTLSGVAGIYNRHSYQAEMRAAVEAYSAHVATLVA